MQAAIEGIYAAGVAAAGKELEKAAGDTFERGAGNRFGRRLDAAAVTHPELLSHVYEWRDITEKGRLWHLSWTGSAGSRHGTMFFEQSDELMTVDPRIEAIARQRGWNLAGHVMPNKATVLENFAHFQLEAGVQKYTERVGGRSQPPRTLLIPGGPEGVMFRKEWRYKNQHFQQLQAFWEIFWRDAQNTVINYMGNEWKAALNTEIKNTIQTHIHGSSRMPRLTGTPGIHYKVDGKPFSGKFNIRPHQKFVKDFTRAIRNRWSKI